MDDKIGSIIGNYKLFFYELKRNLEKADIPIAELGISHLCFRVATLEEYGKVRDRLKGFSAAYSENRFNGRPITMLILKEKLELGNNFSASIIELPAPKQSHKYPTGLEHCGFIVGSKLLEFNEKHKNNLTGIKDRGRFCQPSFVTFKDGKTAKFYERSLKEVVLLEGWNFKTID